MSIARLGASAGWGPVAGVVGLNLVLGLAPVVFIVATSAMIESVVSASGARAQTTGEWLPPLGAFGCALAAVTLQNVLATVQEAVGELLARRVNGDAARRLMRSCMTGPLAVLERGDVTGMLSDARADLIERMGTPGDALAGMLALIARYTYLVGATVIVTVVLGPLPGAVLAITAIAARFGNRTSLRRWTAISRTMQPARRRWWYVADTGASPAVAKDMRTLGIVPWFTARARAESRSMLLPMWRYRKQVYVVPFLGLTVVVLAGAGVAMSMVANAAGAGLSTFEIALAVQAAPVPILFGVFFPESDVQTQAGSEAVRNLSRLDGVLALEKAPSQAGRRHVTPAVPRGDIRFEDVHFHYPNSDREILSGVRLDLRAGTSTAIVGLNAAGKTTLIKLLARLYEPTAGRITVDGVDLRDVAPADWRRQLAVVFQDYLHYELDLAANIRLGAPHRGAGVLELRQALRWADAEYLEAALPAGFGTPLSSRYAGGVDLSGGQWQRVALARAGYAVRGGASTLVLDEPTAQLDARAEVAFFDRFLELTSGLTTVVVSHRFSTVRRADRIVVLANGRITEEGSHVELLRRNGLYAELFQQQAERFRDQPERMTGGMA